MPIGVLSIHGCLPLQLRYFIRHRPGDSHDALHLYDRRPLRPRRLLIRVRRDAASHAAFVGIGLALGFGFLAKTAMASIIPVVLVILAVLLRSLRDRRTWIAAAAAAIVSLPFVVALSRAQEHFTIGDSGRLNYSFLVDHFSVEGYKDDVNSPGPIPHPFAVLLNEPRVLSFTSHLTGTYPIQADPAWWCAGYLVPFVPRLQWETLLANLPPLIVMCLGCPALWLGIACLLRGGRAEYWRHASGLWFLLVPASIVAAEYAAVFVLPRYLAPSLALMAFAALACAWKVHLPARIRR